MSQTYGILFVVSYLYLSTFVFILPWLCEDLGFSLFYKSSKNTKERVENINYERSTRALKFFAKTERISPSAIDFKGPQRSDLQFAFVIVSVQRDSNPHYLLQVVSRLLEQTTAEGLKTKVVVLNADTNPSDNVDAKFLAEYVTVVTRQTLLEGINASVVVDNVYEKEKQDYALALQIGVHLDAEYTVVIEDDGLPDKNFIQNLRFLIAWRISWLRSKPGWAFVKLYYPEKWQGFGNPEIPEIVLIFLVGGFIPACVYVKFSKKSRLKKPVTVALFLTGGLYFSMVAYSVGRAHLLELGKISPLFYRVSKAPGCCTPAVLFQKLYIAELTEFFSMKQCSKEYPLDFALGDFASGKKLATYLASPNLVSHIGYHSSLKKANKDLREFSLLFDP